MVFKLRPPSSEGKNDSATDSAARHTLADAVTRGEISLKTPSPPTWADVKRAEQENASVQDARMVREHALRLRQQVADEKRHRENIQVLADAVRTGGLTKEVQTPPAEASAAPSTRGKVAELRALVLSLFNKRMGYVKGGSAGTLPWSDVRQEDLVWLLRQTSPILKGHTDESLRKALPKDEVGALRLGTARRSARLIEQVRQDLLAAYQRGADMEKFAADVHAELKPQLEKLSVSKAS